MSARKPISATLIPYAVVLLLVITLPNYFDWVEQAGHLIPQDDLTGDYVTGVKWAVVLGLLIFLWPVPFAHRVALVLAWVAKCFVTLVVMLAYENNYGLDAYNYFAQSQLGQFKWSAFQFGKGTENIINLARLYDTLLPSSYHAMKVTFALIGLIAVYLVYRGVTLYLRRDDLRLLFLLALYPSIIFWSSILGKDPVVLLGIALYLYGVAGWRRKGSIAYIIPILLGIFIAASIRIWLAPIFLAPLVVFFINRNTGIVSRAAFISLAIGALLLAITTFAERFSIESTEDVVATTELISKSWARGGSGQLIQSDLGSIAAMIAFLPKGGFTALFRPLPGEIMNPFGLLSGLENLFLLILLVIAVVRTRLRDFRDPLVLWAIVTVLTWTTAYAFVSYQNLGGAVRFKLQILPVLLPLLLYLARRRGGGFDAPARDDHTA